MRLLLLADIHIGSIKDSSYVYNVITGIIDKEVCETHTDAVIILGDYFDRLFKVNEDYVALAINTMSYLIRACAKNKTKIRIVYGTESHDMNQYRLFNYHFTSPKVDIKLFNTATEEELFPGVNVLYMPEEYMKDKHEHYKDTLYNDDKHYQFIFGHGMIIEGMPAIISQTRSASNEGEKQVPMFKSKELSMKSDFTAFGHIHTHVDMEDNVHYIGSLFRKSFGEEEDKGYGIWDDGKFTFIVNEAAYTYKTYEFQPDSTIYESADDILKEFDKIKMENQELFNGEKEGKIRVIFHTPENVDPTFHDNLKTIIFNDKLITPLIKESSNEIINEVKDEISDEYGFILDSSMKITDKIHTFIQKQYEFPITLEELEKYINEPLSI